MTPKLMALLNPQKYLWRLVAFVHAKKVCNNKACISVSRRWLSIGDALFYLRRVQYVGRSLGPDLLVGHRHCIRLGLLHLVPDGGQPMVTSCCVPPRGGKAKTSEPRTVFPSWIRIVGRHGWSVNSHSTLHFCCLYVWQQWYSSHHHTYMGVGF